MSYPFFLHAVRVWVDDIELTEFQKEYYMSQIGQTIKTVTIKPEAIPVPSTPAPAPMPIEEPVKTG